MNPSPSISRYRLLELIFLILFIGLTMRLVQVQLFKHGYYLELAGRQWEKKVCLPALRGDIFDSGGTPLAVSSLQYRVSCDPSRFRELSGERRQEALLELSRILDMDERELRRALGGSGRYAVLHEGLTLDVEEQECLVGGGLVTLERKARRLYPLGSIGSALIGFVNAAGEGVSGIEAGLQDRLAGMAGEAVYQKDYMGRPLLSSRNHVLVEPVQGDDVFLSIDHKVQAIADMELAAAVRASEACAGCIVVLDTRSGDILALASWPAPVGRDCYAAEEWCLLPVQACYEPGSTMKALSSIALIEQGGVTFATQEDAEDGRAMIDGFPIRDDREHYGFLSFKEAFTVSSNICFAKFSQRLSNEDLFATLQSLGFGNRYGLPLPHEMDGLLRKPSDWSKRSKMTLVFGQEMSATPLQMTAAFAALGNDGRLMRPRLQRAVRPRNDKDLELIESVFLRRVCRPETVDMIMELLAEVVENGTGTRAAIPGIPVGGKTGTAQKWENGRLKKGKYFASFIGLAPLDEPRLAVGVFLDEPRYGMHHGGQSAAPAFARVVERVAISTCLLGETARTATDLSAGQSGVEVPLLLEMTAGRADSVAIRSGLRVKFRGRGSRIVGQEPAAGMRLRPDQDLLLTLGDPDHPAGDAPMLLGKSLREARRLALSRGYRVIPRGIGTVVWQGEPDPDEQMAIPLQLELKPGGRNS